MGVAFGAQKFCDHLVNADLLPVHICKRHWTILYATPISESLQSTRRRLILIRRGELSRSARFCPSREPILGVALARTVPCTEGGI